MNIDIPQSEISEEYNTGFKNGFQAALKSGWIKYYDGLPDKNTGILAYYPDEAIKIRIPSFNAWDSYDLYGSTHWMPLPEPPE